ncbi:histidine kinase [Pseudoalteromonas sp. SSM20]|uniref:histidine kinase n=1 Tax=Pseudoalteromonas sp. SSM20 TaxID=3139394 RepID=UPI003BA972CA
MLNRAKRSIVFRISTLMTSVIAMAFISIFSSVYISELSEFDGAAINLSGSMRMLTFKTTSQIADYQNLPSEEKLAHIHNSISRFEKKLNNSILKIEFTQHKDIAIEHGYNTIKTTWQEEIIPLFNQAIQQQIPIDKLLFRATAFVDLIDKQVILYQQKAESRLELLRIVQITTLFITLILIYICLYSVHYKISIPLKELTNVAKKSTQGDFSHRVNLDQQDELGLLANTINAASDTIETMYGNLEKRIASKTKKLKRSKDMIELLFDISNQTNQSASGELMFQPIIEQLADISEISDIDLCLLTPEGDVPFQHLVSSPQQLLLSACVKGNCATCHERQYVYDNSSKTIQIKFPLQTPTLRYGVLVVNLPEGALLDPWQSQLFKSVADQITLALSLQGKSHQQRRIALHNERSIIARELHDSLAQSLSYLKIQVTRIQKGVDKEVDKAALQEIIAELREGLSSAYRQLRELLTTFRLQITDSGLQQALSDTLDLLQQRTAMRLSLDYQIGNIPLSPTEEIHILQVAKEALQNSVYHSKGTEASISIAENADKTISLAIKDNGVGIGNDPQKINHYGLAIMRERSTSLNGEFNINEVGQGGTEVHVRFKPTYLNAHAA